MLETNQEVREAGLLQNVEDIPDEEVGTEDVPYELDTEQQMEEAPDGDDDMPELEEELPPNVTVEKEPEVRAQADVNADMGPPELTAPPELPPRRSSRNISRKKTISEELNCKLKFIKKPWLTSQCKQICTNLNEARFVRKIRFYPFFEYFSYICSSCMHE